jgi:hypothetical protein
MCTFKFEYTFPLFLTVSSYCDTVMQGGSSSNASDLFWRLAGILTILIESFHFFPSISARKCQDNTLKYYALSVHLLTFQVSIH